MVTLARHAMATRFEIVLPGENAAALRAAGEEALGEIERLEAQLSLYRPTSEIAHVNARAAKEAVRVTPRLFALLEHAQRLHDESGGAFDITIAPLVRCWGFMGGTGHMPQAEELAEARAKVGMNQVRLSAQDSTVRFTREGVMLDFGAIGKGYAIERAVEVLREAGVTTALLHGGTSTVYGLGHPPELESWKIAVESPKPSFPLSSSGREGRGEEARQEAPATQEGLASLPTISLRDEAMSVSAVWGRSFQAQGRSFGHVLDPRSGEPVSGTLLSAVVLPSATETDALSTALLVRGAEGHQAIWKLRPGMRTLLVNEAGADFRVETHGLAERRAGRREVF